MIFFQWSDMYDSGNKTMDNDHRVLVSMINELYTEMAKGDGMTIVNSVLHRLIDYSRDHLSREEQLMQAVCYPELAEHKAEHNAFIVRLNGLIKNQKSDSITLDLAKFLKSWLSGHILHSDKKLASYVDLHRVELNTQQLNV